MLTKQQEKILIYLLSLERDNKNKTNISRKNYILEDVSENDFINALNYFEQCSLINKHWYDVHQRDFNYAIEIEFLPKALTYFSDKKNNNKNNNLEFIKWLIPVIISLLSLLWNILNTIYTYHLQSLINQP